METTMKQRNAEPTVLEMIETILSTTDYTPVIASNAREAFDYADVLDDEQYGEEINLKHLN